MNSTDGWIDLTEYAAKYRVSQSTLRRRIRGNTIAYRMDRGKYLLLDSAEALHKAPLFSRQNNPRPTTPRQSPAQMWKKESWSADSTASLPQESAAQRSAAHAVLEEEVQRLRSENKILREQLAEVETLVKVLEAELQSYNA